MAGKTADGPHPVDVHVGRRIAQLRNERGVTQADLAQTLGVTFQQVQKYEKGANRVSASKLWLTAAALNVGIDQFFPDEAGAAGEPPSPSPSPAAADMARVFDTLKAGRRRALLAFARQLAVDE